MTIERLTSALAERYTMERELGAGGMATVYLAHDVKHDRKVAVKVLRPELAAVIGAERFVNEIKVTANLQHPHILALYDSGEADAFLYYVMPYVQGESLGDKLAREKQLGVEDAVRIASEVASALDYAHRQGVVHRDIKPANIMLQDGQALVADFGIALALRAAGGDRLTETGLSLGTPHYMSPEQATGDRDIDARSDQYSLAAVLYECLAGEPPHTGGTIQAVISKVVTEEPKSLVTQRHSVPAHVAMAVEKALAKIPADRFASAAEFATALKDPGFTLARAGVAAARGEQGAPTRLLGRAGVVGWVVAAVLGIIVVALALRPASPPRVARYSVALPASEALYPTSRGDRLAFSPDGSLLAYAGPGDGGARVYLRPRDRLSATALPGTDRAVHVFFAPDGQRVGFVADESPQAVKIVSVSGGPPLTLIDSAVGLDGATWSSDGYVYLDGITAGGTTGLLRVSEAGGRAEQVTTVDTAQGESDHVWPEALPNGTGLLFTVMHGPALANADIAATEVPSGAHRVLLRGVAATYSPSGHLVYVTADGALLAAPFDQDRLEVTGQSVALVEGVAVRAFGSVDVAIAHDGTLVYVTGARASDPSEIVWVDEDGTATPVDPGWVGDFQTLALSPDERLLAVSMVQGSEEHVWVKQLPDGPLSKLTFEGTQNFRPSWSADSREITFISNRGSNQDVFMKRADGSDLARVLLDRDLPVWEGYLGGSGEWLVYRMDPWNLFAQSTSGDSVTIAASGFEERSPSLSPDGRWVAYQSSEALRMDVFVRPFPEAQSAKWQVSVDGGRFPLWSRDGRVLYYRTLTDEVVAVEVLVGPTFATGERRVLFTSNLYRNAERSWDITSDGRLLMIRSRTAGDPSQLVLVENFAEELKQRVGGSP